MNKLLKTSFFILTLAFVNFLAADALAAGPTFQGIIANVTKVLQSVIPILILIATIVFAWGVILYISAAGDEEKIKEGRQYIIWGIIGLAIIISVWGIVKIVVTLFFGANPDFLPPQFPDLPGKK